MLQDWTVNLAILKVDRINLDHQLNAHPRWIAIEYEEMNFRALDFVPEMHQSFHEPSVFPVIIKAQDQRHFPGSVGLDLDSYV